MSEPTIPRIARIYEGKPYWLGVGDKAQFEKPGSRFGESEAGTVISLSSIGGQVCVEIRADSDDSVYTIPAHRVVFPVVEKPKADPDLAPLDWHPMATALLQTAHPLANLFAAIPPGCSITLHGPDASGATQV